MSVKPTKILSVTTGENMIDYELLKTSIITFVVVIVSLTVHEVSHGFVSYLLGDDTAKRLGRLTLNPIKHIDIIGAVCMFVFKFGWAKAVPINPDRYKNFRLGTVIVSIAGPLSNLIMSFVATFVYVYMTFKTSVDNVLIYEFLITFIVLNISLAVFNLIPVSPLDGSKILLAFLPEKAYRFVLRYERYGFIVLIALSYFGFFSGVIDKGLYAVFSAFARFSAKIIF